MTLSIDIPKSLKRFLSAVADAGRRNLFSVAAENLHRLVQAHLMRITPARHATADRLGGVRTGHLEKGISRSSFSADENHAEVIIPVAGINRAFGPVTITPKNSRALTIPVSGAAYGHRVAEMRRMGWSIFRPKGRDVLMGERDGKTTPLYALKKRVTLKQDRTLLPDDARIRGTVARAMMAEIQRVARKAG